MTLPKIEKSVLILAALEGPDTLEGCLAGTQSPTPPKRVRKTATAAAKSPFSS